MLKQTSLTQYCAICYKGCEDSKIHILFVGQLLADKSLALHALDLISFTTDLQTVNYYSAIHDWS